MVILERTLQYGMQCVFAPGVVTDGDYRAEIMVILYNVDKEELIIGAGTISTNTHCPNHSY